MISRPRPTHKRPAGGRAIDRLDPALAAWQPEILLYPYSHILWGCLLAVLLEDERWFRRLSL